MTRRWQFVDAVAKLLYEHLAIMADKNKDNLIFKAYMECREALVRSIRKACAQPEDVDDILQETYLRAYQANEKRPISSPKDYLFVVSRNLVYKSLAHQSKEIVTEIDDTLLDVEHAPLDHDLHFKLKLEVLNDAFSSLPEKQRRAILLRKFYGFSHKEIAKKMGVTVSSVEKYISFGLKHCEKVLCSRGYENESETKNIKKTSR